MTTLEPASSREIGRGERGERGKEAAIDRALAGAVMARFLARVLGPVGAARAPAAPRGVGVRGGPGAGQRGHGDEKEELGERERGAEKRELGGWVALSAAAALLDCAAAGSTGIERDESDDGRLDADGRASLGELVDAVSAVATSSGPEPATRERLYGHTLRGAVCPYESEYGNRELIQQAHELADLVGFYEAFGLEPATHHRERPDHVACELEFLDFLLRKDAWALQAGDGAMHEITRQATAKFLRRHLGRFGRTFAVSLQDADPQGYYGRIGILCERFLGVACRSFEVPLGPATLELNTRRDAEVPMACGSSADELVQIGGDLGGSCDTSGQSDGLADLWPDGRETND